jgi:RHS repeat-associated protein
MKYSFFIKSALIIALETVSCQVQGQNIPSGTNRPAATPLTFQGTYQNPSKSYIRIWEPQMPTTDVVTATSTARSAQEVLQATYYSDGLNRPLQTVVKGVSTSGKDLVIPHLYDTYSREAVRLLPYIPKSGNTSDGKFKSAPFADQKDFYQDTVLNPAAIGESIFYSQDQFDETPSSPLLKEFGPGNTWANEGGKRHRKQYIFINTVADSVRVWTLSATDIPISTALYAAGQLTKTVFKDESDAQQIIYTDKRGRAILRKTQAVSSPGNGHMGWLCTYYVYDDLGNLRFVLPPKAVTAIMSNWVVSSAIAAELCFIYHYDGRGRVIVKKMPGADSTEMIYDVRDRLAFLRDGNMREQNDWLVTFYDGLDRPVMAAIYKTTAGTSRETLQASLNEAASGTRDLPYTFPGTADLVLGVYDGGLLYQATNSITLTEGFDTGAGAEMTAEINSSATNGNDTITVTNPLPNIPSSALTPLTYTFYDTYDFTGKHAYASADTSKVQVGDNPYPEAFPSAPSTLINGLVTGTKVRVLGTDQWLTTTHYYNDKGRQIQVVAGNINGGQDITTILYDFSGKVLSTYERHRNPRSGTTPETKVLTMMAYDAAGRLVNIKKKLNDTGAEKTIVANEYDELGHLKSKRLGVTVTSQLEKLNYEYNIRGWLKSINKNFIATPNSTTNWFGEELSYDYGFTTNQYDGSIAGAKWKSRGDGIARAYGYAYDPANRLTGADFTQQNQGTTAWARNKVDFTAGGISYDANGNILSLNQRGMKGMAPAIIDSLKYGYTDNSNKLLYVTDRSNDVNSKLGDFKEVTTGTASDYTYDANGNVAKDSNRMIFERTYNILDQPDYIVVPGKGKIQYLYSASGEKVRKTVTDNQGHSEVTDYIGDFVYVQDSLQYFGHEEGRVRVLYASGVPPALVYDYFVNDHLGNVRMVLTEQSGKAVYAATMETASSTKENALFANIDLCRSAKPAGYPADGTTSPNDYVAKLNATAGTQKIGPSLVLRVMAGDTIQLGCKAFYKSAAASTSNTTVANMLTALLQAFASGGGPSDGMHGNGTGAGSPITTNFTAANYQAIRDKDPDQNQAAKPKAYLNYVLFDDQLQIVDDNSGVRQVQGSPDQLQTLATSTIIMKKTGFLYVYTSNESAQDVFFDNIVVTHNAGPLVEETHYYPFGLTMAGISSKALKNPYAKNNFNYNGIEQNDEFGLNQYEAYYRTLDPQIGRWNQMDPVSGKYPGISPYNSNFNNPISFNDPFGDDPPIWGNWGGYIGWGYPTKEVFGNINWGQELRIGLRNFTTNGFNEIGNYVMRRQQQDSRRYDLENIPIRTRPPVEYQRDQQFELVNGFPKQKEIEYRTTPEAFRQTVNAYRKSFTFVTNYFAPLVENLTLGGLEGILTSGATRAVVISAGEDAANGTAEGGLNLFKFGAEQTTKSGGWKTGDRMLKMFDQGSPKLNWKQNSGFLRREMGTGNPIFDSYRLPNGNLIPTKGFLNAERNLLQSRNWIYDASHGAWLPPGF